MSPEQIQRFFRTLAKEFPHPATVILTGAAVGSVLARVRASYDIDFAITVRPPEPDAWARLEAAIAKTQRVTGIEAQYAEDIDRWSSISLLDYRRHTRPYRRFGALEVRLLEPAYWAIGKLSRYLPQDRDDLAVVLAAQRPTAASLTSLWARALRESPRSQALTLFREHAEDFLRTAGRRIWGPAFDAEQAIQQFRRLLAKHP
jgi:hypothetical protein